jgi:ribonuclease HI
MPALSIEAYFDGCCEPRNPGGTAAWGAYIVINKELVWEGSAIIGHGKGMTNNLAEHAGCLAILQWLHDNGLNDGVDDIIIHGDSMLVIKQMSGEWKIQNGMYIKTARQSRELLKQFVKQPRFKWVPREQNESADRLAKSHMTLDYRLQSSPICLIPVAFAVVAFLT